jgi:LAS superfamily LD-carboxypeptidase LdcB
MVKIIRLTEQDLYRIVKRVLNESIKDNLPSNKALEKLEKDYSVKIEDSHIESEREQEGVDYYEDNGGVDSKSKEQLKKLLSALYSQFKNAPKDKNSNCDNIPGCISGYRGYMTQANVFGSKMKSRKQSVSQRQKVSALPGFSQHHTGKTFDILSVEDSFWDSNPEIKKWVEDNVSKYGFKISYPSNGSLRNAEPWHIYYVGGEVSDEELKKEKNEKIEKKVDDFYASDKENPEVEKKIEKRYEIVGCSPKREYTESPNFDKIKSDSSVVIRIGHKGSPVEEIQKKLVDLGYNIGSCGVDGLFGPRTKKGLEDYQEENNLAVSSAVNQETLESLEKPISEQKKSSSESKRVSEISKNDKEFYGNILKGIGAPITEENLKFFYAWRAAEGGKAKNNPFNTTQGMKDDPGISVYGKNKAGVKNYSTSEFGIKATIKTLLNGRYPCIVDGLKNDIGAEKISECFDNLETWGTGELVNKVIKSGSIRNVPINTDYESDEKSKKEETKSENNKSETKVSQTNDDEYIIIRPDGYTGNKVHVLFGGHSTNPGYSKNGANMSAMKNYVKVLKPYANNIIIVITHHMNTLGNVKKYVDEKFGGKVSSIAGFSQGGKETWRHADDSSLSLVGLVDPSTYKTGLPFGSNTILYCAPTNWGTSGFYGETRERLEWYCSHKEEYGGKVECFYPKGDTHQNFGILKDFYSKFSGKL